jgi:FxsC-like protein
MRYWFFFSYARDNKDRFLERFYRDLHSAVAGLQYFDPQKGEEPSFMDAENLQLMSSWTHHLMNALQASRTFVCTVTPAYVNKQFCGKEFWLFDRRRRHGLPKDAAPPGVMLPVIWIPTEFPAAITSAQFDHADLPDEYKKHGLQYLMKLKRTVQYEKCVQVFARALIDAGRAHPAAPPFPYQGPFEDVPGAFEPAGSHLARFAFLAGPKSDFAGLPIAERYSPARSCYWKPFNPPVAETVAEMAETIAIDARFGYEELPVDATLANKVLASKPNARVILVVDPWTLRNPTYREFVKPIDKIEDPPSVIFAPLNSPDQLTPEERAELDAAMAETFPSRSNQNNPDLFRKGISNAGDLRAEIARALASAHLKDISSAAEQKPPTGTLPVLSAAPAGTKP